MDVYELIEEVNAAAASTIEGMARIRPDVAGLDERSACFIYVDSAAIAVPLASDRSLQYYGGFEYVDEDCRVVVGEYVFYLRDDELVEGHIEAAEENGTKLR